MLAAAALYITLITYNQIPIANDRGVSLPVIGSNIAGVTRVAAPPLLERESATQEYAQEPPAPHHPSPNGKIKINEKKPRVAVYTTSSHITTSFESAESDVEFETASPAKLTDDVQPTTAPDHQKGPAPCSSFERWSEGWWTTCDEIISLVRLRRGGSYENQSTGPVLDMANVAIGSGVVHVYQPDALSREAISAAGYLLRGNGLRSNNINDIQIMIHESAMPLGACNPSEAGDSAVFAVKPW